MRHLGGGPYSTLGILSSKSTYINQKPAQGLAKTEWGRRWAARRPRSRSATHWSAV